MNKEFALIQGAFLSVNRISPLSSLQKADWDKVGCSVLKVLGEIAQHQECTQEVKKSLVCAVWLKLLSAEAEEDIDVAWRESQFFALQNGLPELNRDVLLELVRSSASISIYTRLLLCLPPTQFCYELEQLVKHTSSSPVREEDVHFLLEVWWELWSCNDVQKDSTEETFMKEVGRLSSNALQQPAKRLKLDTPDLSSSDPNVLYIFLHALRDLKDHIITSDLGFKALAISINAFYTSFFADGSNVLSTKKKVQILSQIAPIRENQSPEIIKNSLRDLHVCWVPSLFKPMQLKLETVFGIITDAIEFWVKTGLLKVENNSNPSYCVFKLKLGLQNVTEALNKAEKTVDYSSLEKLLESLHFSDEAVTDDVSSNITKTIISHQMDDYRNFALLFAGEKNWTTCDDNYTDFLEKNQSAFRQPNTLSQLTKSIVDKFNCELHPVSVSHRQKLMKVTADIFTALSLNDKNKVLAEVLEMSTTGFFGCSVPSAVTSRFEQELNMAFNCIIQGGGASASNLNTAVSLVARVAFQNPEASLKAVCNSVISNKGTFSLMAKILQQLPGLSGRLNELQSKKEEAAAMRAKGLLCLCLKKSLSSKPRTDDEMEQMGDFLSLLMQPVEMIQGEGRRKSFLSPQTVVNEFVVSYFELGCVNLELSLQVLHSALRLDVQDTAPHWVMDCCPFPVLLTLAGLHNNSLRRWELPSDELYSMETQELVVTVLSTLGQVVGAQVAANPNRWSRSLFWLYKNTEQLDWTVRFLLKSVWGEHFKNEVPSSLLTVCELPEQEWSGLDLPRYGPGTGLLAWIECCCISDTLQSTMLSCLNLDQSQPDHVNMFSKGLLVALTQILPCCFLSQWIRLLRALKILISSGRLHVPFSLEYCEYLPLMDLRRFACELRLSALLLRVFQLLCGSSCSHWLPRDGWGHVGTLYAHAVRDIISSLKTKLPLPASGKGSAPVMPKMKESTTNHKSHEEEKLVEESVPGQEVLFVLSQLYCHVQHVQVMQPEGQSEQLFLSSLEILSHYEAVLSAFPESSSALESDNTRHFFSTITDNLQNDEMKSVLQQKISQLKSTAA